MQPVCADADGSPLEDANVFCARSWCYVDPWLCDSAVRSAYFPDDDLYYSYDACAIEEEAEEEDMEEEEEDMEEVVEEEEEAAEEEEADPSLFELLDALLADYDGPAPVEEEEEAAAAEEEAEEENEEDDDPLDAAWIAQMLAAELGNLAGFEAEGLAGPEEIEEEPEQDCSCLPQHGLPVYWTEEGVHYIEYTDDEGTVHQYTPDYGTSCKAWDADLPPSCTGDDAPDSCAQSWCWVNPDTCDSGIQGSYFPDSELWFSYDTCRLPETSVTSTSSMFWDGVFCNEETVNETTFTLDGEVVDTTFDTTTTIVLRQICCDNNVLLDNGEPLSCDF